MVKVFTVVLLASILCGLAHVDGKRVRQCTGQCQTQDVDALMNVFMPLKIKEHEECVSGRFCPTVVEAIANISCSGGWAGEYECNNVDLLAFVPLAELGSSGVGNDIWGWTDPVTGKEYAIMGCEDGTSFVDVTDPINPLVIAFLPTHTSKKIWRDIKVYNNHAFIGSEACQHGLQVYDLTKLRDLNPPVNLVNSDAHYREFGKSHNIVINEETGFLYSVGSDTCRSGLHVVNIQDPLHPQFAGCFGNDGYVHDAQCVMYRGPDCRYQQREICFCYNEDTLTIVDVEDKKNMRMLSRVAYNGSEYTHQGWLNEAQTHLLSNDERDEHEDYGNNSNTRTLIWNVEDLEQPVLIDSFYSEKHAIDHNLYIKGNLTFETNYCAGLRILDSSQIEKGVLKEVGYFDVDPTCDSPLFHGSWSNYPYFKSGTIVVSSIERGLFVLKYTGSD